MVHVVMVFKCNFKKKHAYLDHLKVAMPTRLAAGSQAEHLVGAGLLCRYLEYQNGRR